MVEPARLQASLDTPPFHQWTLPDGVTWTYFHRTHAGYLLRFPDLADFEIAGETLAVTCHPVPGVTEEVSRHLFLNQVWPLVLSKKGALVFHASAVEVPGGAVAFVAESGRGKSTLAASFAAEDCPFLTDDGLLVEPWGDLYRAVPSHPSIRLWEDSEEALVSRGTRTAPPLHYTSKARFLAEGSFAFCAEPRVLRRAYFLGDGTAADVRFERMTSAAVLMQWVRHSFLLDPEERVLLAAHFDRVSRLANRLPCYTLDFPRRFECLPDVRRAIIAHREKGGESA